MDEDRETACAAPIVPGALAEAVAGYRWARNLVGEAGAAVYRLYGAAGQPDLYLKHGRGSAADDVIDEMARLRWLAGRVAVPRVVRFILERGDAWLLTTAMPGQTAWQAMTAAPGRRAALTDALATFLGELHRLPVADCPFEAGAAHRMAQARRRIDAGLVEEEDFDDARAGWRAEQVWDAMTALLPFGAERVVTHGDYSLDNILIGADCAVAGVIDVGRAGIADPYQDLAILWNCLGEFDPALQDRLFAAYGIAMPDQRRLDFHLMLDEMF